MTCVVGIVHDGQIYMGGDSAGSNYTGVVSRRDPKVFYNGEFLIGYTTSFRMGQLLRFMVPPAYHSDVDPYRYMVTDFVETVRDTFEKGGFNRKTSDQDHGGLFMVGFRGELYIIENDYQVGLTNEDCFAIGSGEEYAFGSLYATRGKPPRERIVTALEAASFYNPFVRAPYLIYPEEVAG